MMNCRANNEVEKSSHSDINELDHIDVFSYATCKKSNPYVSLFFMYSYLFVFNRFGHDWSNPLGMIKKFVSSMLP